MPIRNLKIVCCLCLLFFIAANVKAADTLYFVGHIKISTSVSYKYNLRFVINNENKLVGYSLSDPGGANEVKTKITGIYDSVRKTISYEEKSILRSSVDLKKNDLCFVKATLKFKKTKLIETLSGKFTASEPDKNTPCASGEVRLINTDRYKTIMKQINNEPAEAEIITPKNSKNKTVEISSEKGKAFLITGNTVTLTIWDNGQIDGDKVSVLLNGKYILQDYTITSVTKIMQVQLSGNDRDTIEVVALNEGSLPPNTAAIKIETKTEQYQILTQAKTDEVRTIYLQKK